MELDTQLFTLSSSPTPKSSSQLRLNFQFPANDAKQYPSAVDTARFPESGKAAPEKIAALMLSEIDLNTVDEPKNRRQDVEHLISQISAMEADLAIDPKTSEIDRLAQRIRHKFELLRSQQNKSTVSTQSTQFKVDYLKFQDEKASFDQKLVQFRQESKRLQDLRATIEREDSQVNKMLQQLAAKTEEVDSLRSEFTELCTSHTKALDEKAKRIADDKLAVSEHQAAVQKRMETARHKFQSQKREIDQQERFLKQLITQRVLAKRVECMKTAKKSLDAEEQTLNSEFDGLSKELDQLTELQESLLLEKTEIENTASLFENIQAELNQAKKDLGEEKKLAEQMRLELESERGVMMEIIDDVERKKVDITEREQGLTEIGLTLEKYESLTLGKGLDMSDRFNFNETNENTSRLSEINRALEDSTEFEMPDLEFRHSPDLPRKCEELKLLS